MTTKENNWLLAPCDKPDCFAPIGQLCRTKNATPVRLQEVHTSRRKNFYQQFPDKAPVWWPYKLETPPMPADGHYVENLLAESKRLKEENAELKSQIRLTALDRALTHHRDQYEKTTTYDKVVATARGFETYLIEPASKLECAECGTAPGNPHAPSCSQAVGV